MDAHLGEGGYWLVDATVPRCCVVGAERLEADHNGLSVVDVEIRGGLIASVVPAGAGREARARGVPVVSLEGGMCWPTMADLHTHIDKSHTCERTRNPAGTLSGADKSTERDSKLWDMDDVCRRMEFSLRCAYAHGTSALRTHLINLTPKQIDLTWAAFARLKKKWASRVELQGVSLSLLSFFRDLEQATALADLVQREGGVLGAAVCCGELGGSEKDDYTTCNSDRDMLLDRIFTLASERNLDLDFHVDENGNEGAKGLRYVAQKTIEHGYQGRVVCGHCCSLAYQPPEELKKTLQAAHDAQITVVSLPLVNEWTQDRSPPEHCRTPRWRGITTLKELMAAGVSTALSSDNARDQFYEYGDLDMMEVFTQSVRMGHLDRPSMGDWPCSITSVPAAAMGLKDHGRIAVGRPANLVLFRARRFSELLSRGQHDRIVIRDGRPVRAALPDYRDLDTLVGQDSKPLTNGCTRPARADVSLKLWKVRQCQDAHINSELRWSAVHTGVAVGLFAVAVLASYRTTKMMW